MFRFGNDKPSVQLKQLKGDFGTKKKKVIQTDANMELQFSLVCPLACESQLLQVPVISFHPLESLLLKLLSQLSFPDRWSCYNELSSCEYPELLP